jgi:Carboxypeptidase regulatory-like domain
VKFDRVPTGREDENKTLQTVTKSDNRQIARVPAIRARKHLLLLWMLLGVILALPVAMSAQLTTADVVGTVTDTTGAVVPNANVTLTNQRTNETRNTQSTGGGQYSFTVLLPGNYSVRVEAQGFTTFTSNVNVSAGDRTRVDASMQVGQSSETIEVTSPSPLLQTETSTVANTVPEQHVENLPLNTRNLTTLVTFVPGANEGASVDSLSSGQRPDDRRQTSSFSVNGQDVELNNAQIDGTDNNERIIGTIGVKPSIDAIQEVTVETNNYTAESGRTPGGLVSVITKSGSNSFHGSLYEYFQNNAFNARNPFNPSPQFPQSEFRQNDFGGSVGGPIIKDRTFFFFAYEGFRQVAGVQNPITSTVPTAAEQALGPAGIVAADPATAGLAVDPIAANLFKLYPLPNIGASGQETNNFLFDPNRTQFSTTFDARVDHHFSNNDLFYARFTSNNVSSVIPTNLPNVTINGVSINPGNGQFGFAGPAKDVAYNGQLNYTHIFSSNLLLELKAAYTRIDNTSNSPNSGTNAATAVGFPSNINFGPLASSGLSLINVAGFAPLGDSNFVPIVDISNTFEYNGAITYNRGSHSLKFGAALIRRQAQNQQSSNGVGNINFGLPEDGGSASLNNLATFLVGAFTAEGRNTDLFTPNYRSWEPGFYAQDSWKARPWLTLNYGLRYDIFTPFTEADGRISNFDPATNTLLVPAHELAVLNTQGVDTTGIVGSSNTAGLKTTYSNFEPRVGFAASLGHETVLRGGFGIAAFPGNYTSNASLKNAPFNGVYAPSINGQGCQSTLATQIETFSTGSSTLPSCQASLGQTTALAQGIPIPVPQALNSPSLSLPDNVALNFRTSYVEQFNLLLQKQFGQNVISVGYVGSVGRHLPVVINDINVPNPLTAPASLRGPDGRFDTRPTAAILPGLGGVGEYESIGSSSYHSLQTSFQRRYSKGLTVSVNYTYSHSIDDATTLSYEGQEGFGNANPFAIHEFETGNSDLDLRHRFVGTVTYELPFGKNFDGAKKLALAGWQANSVLIWNSGSPFTITDNFTGFANSVFNGIGGGPTRPNQIADATLSNPSIGEWFNTSAFVIPPLGTIGNTPRNSLYGPSFRHFDLSIFKDFALTERFKLQFRAEAFNLTNTPSYFVANNQNDAPTTNAVQGAGFGKIVITNPNYTPRALQLALKLVF